MKSFELQPTHDNLMSTLTENLIERNIDVYRFVLLLDSIDTSCSIALDGAWGSGKTFFSKQSKMVLEAYNQFFGDADSDDVATIKRCMGALRSRKKEEFSIQPQVPVYYDAWSNDNNVDPILSLVYEIIQSVNTSFSLRRGKDCLHIAGAIADFFSGKKVTTLLELVKTEDPLASLKTQEDIHTLVTSFLESLLPEQGNRLVIFIDELDRCKPSYAVQLLERIKHYFANDLITFVFSVNLDELQHTIKRYYGDGFDACRYLDRFFDLHVSLPPANINRYFDKMGLNDSTYVYEAVCKAVIKANNFQLREIAKYYRIAKAAAYNPTHGNGYDFSFSEEKALEFCLLCIVPVMIGTKISSIERYNAFIHGKDSSPLLDVIGDGQIAIGMCASLLSRGETYEESADIGITQVKLSDKLNKAYEALFVQDYSHGVYQKSIGQITFEEGTRKNLMKAASLLSGFADYSI